MSITLCVLLWISPVTLSDDSVREASIPKAVTRALKAKGFDAHYAISFHLKPFYLRGDFNGDGKPDCAVLIKSKKTGKKGIGVVHSGNNEVFILGAGTVVGNGGDDFDWMDNWNVYPKGRVHKGVGERKVPTLLGEALNVEKSEAAGGLIYWNGKKYVWYQQGD